MLIYITGLTQIPGDVLEAAKIDGATPLQTLLRVKIPMIASTFTICTFLTLTSAFKQFDVNMALTNGTGSVADFLGNYLSNGTQMLALNIYNTAISKNSYALGQAKAVFFFLILAVVSLIQVRMSNAREGERRAVPVLSGGDELLQEAVRDRREPDQPEGGVLRPAPGEPEGRPRQHELRFHVRLLDLRGDHGGIPGAAGGPGRDGGLVSFL